MKRCNWKLLLAGACLFAIACTKSSHKQERTVGNSFRDGQVIVTTDKLDELMKQNPGLTSEEVWPEIHMYMVRGKSLAGKEREISAEWEKSGLAQHANPNFIHHLSDLPDRTTDPYWLDLWGLNNIGQDAPKGTEGKEGADIKVMQAWKYMESKGMSKGSDSVLVAIMDTGIDYLHDDLKDNIYVNKAELTGQEHVDEDNDGFEDDIYGWNFCSTFSKEKYGKQLGKPDPMDGNGHGTHVSGTIGAVANNGIGVAGINQHVKLIALKVLSDEGSGDEHDIIRAVRYAAMKKVDVVNASFGGGGESDNFYYALKQAGEAGVLFVAAAGNDGEDGDEKMHYPSAYDLDNVISVAATDNRDQLAVFSNYGYKKVDIAAPGVNIISTYPRKLAAEEGTPDNPYRVFSGTSMATPHVTGAAALVLAARPELKGKPAELKRVLMESSDWLPQLAGRIRSGGRLNVFRAITNDVRPMIDSKNWKEVAVQGVPYASPNTPEGHVDVSKTFTVKGAKAIQAHVKTNLMDAIDLSAVYDGALRLVSFIPSDLAPRSDKPERDYWTPVVYGDSVTVRFANALVTVKNVKQKLKGISEADASQLTGDVMCFPSQTEGKMDCTIWGELSDPFGNNRSEGFTIDKIRVIEGDAPAAAPAGQAAAAQPAAQAAAEPQAEDGV